MTEPKGVLVQVVVDNTSPSSLTGAPPAIEVVADSLRIGKASDRPANATARFIPRRLSDEELINITK